MENNKSFHYEVEKLPDDELGNKVTAVRCHGKLVIENAFELKEGVKPLLPLGGRIVIDLSDLNYLDSAGLGALLAIKASAIKQGYCKVQFVKMTPRILDLLRLTNLEQYFSS